MIKLNWISERNDMLEFHVQEDKLLTEILEGSFLSQRKDNVFYLFRNNYTAAWLRKNKDWIKHYFDYNKNVLNKFATFQEYERPREEPIPFITLPGIELFPFQMAALQTMLDCERNCLFFGPGTGKTIMALNYIAAVAAVDDKAKFVVVTLKNVLGQYEEEAKKYLDESVDVVFINPESIHKLPDTNYTGVIFDESHRLKNMSSQIHNKALDLASRSRDVYHFSGTPQDASRDEIMSQIRILAPYLVPYKTHFMERYFYLDDYYKPKFEKRPSELDEIIVRMTIGDTTDNLLDLPPENHNLIECKFKDKTIYNEYDANHLAVIDGVHFISEGRGPAVIALKQISSGFIYETKYELYEKDGEEKTRKIQIPHRLENPKEEPMRELLVELDSALIFTRFDEEQNIITEILDQYGFSYETINGKRSDKDNQKAIDKFKAKEIKFLVSQIRKGSAGLHFVATTNIIYYSIPDSFITYDQSKYRIRRHGQTEECNYYSLVVRGTEDRHSINRISRKLAAHNKNFKLFRRKTNGKV